MERTRTAMNWNEIETKSLALLAEQGWHGLSAMCKLLQEQVTHYQWVGIYWMNNSEQLLQLGPFAGAETEHTKIPYGRGICGQVAVSGASFEVPDVWAQDNYLACSMETKSELVVPIYSRSKLIGQIDIDSHFLNPFGPEDHKLLETLAQHIGSLPEAATIG